MSNTRRAAKASLLAAALMLTPVIRGGAESSEDAQRTVFEARYAAVRAAMTARDADTIAALLTADFVSEDADGQVSSAAKMIRDVLALPKDPQKVSSTIVLTVEVADDVATVTQRYRMTTVRIPAAGAQEQHIEVVTESTDTWVKQSGAWVLKKTVTDTLDYTIDGKLVVHKVHAPRRRA